MDIQSYISRIGLSQPPEPTLKGLEQLMKAHLYSVPFENIDVVAGRYIDLNTDQFYEKIVQRKRGGFCYELNGLFNLLLNQLGYKVDLIAATVKQKDGTWAYPNSHATNVVYLERPYLVDVGFGDSFIKPIPINGKTHRDASGLYRIKKVENELDLQRYEGYWRTQFRFTLTPFTFKQFYEAAHYTQTSPESMFTNGLIVTKRLMDGRVTITDKDITVTSNRSKTRRLLHHHEEMLNMIEDYTHIPKHELHNISNSNHMFREG